MVDFSFSDEEKMLKKFALEFAEREITPKLNSMEETNETPMDVLKKMGDLGFGGVLVPEEYGGTDMGHVARIALLEEIGTVSAALANVLQVHHLGQSPVIYFGTEEQKKKFLPSTSTLEHIAGLAVTEASGGSDPLGGKTTARKEGDVYILNGEKSFITNSSISHFMGITAIDEEQTKIRGRTRLSCFILERGTKGFRAGYHEDLFGLRGSDTGELVIEDCEVPVENLIGGAGSGMRVALTCISHVGRPGIGASALGIARKSLEEAVRYSNERKIGGNPISSFQLIQKHISDMYIDYETSRWAAYYAAWLRDKGLSRPDAELALCKLLPTEAAVKNASRLIEIYGALGNDKGTLPQRLLRDAWPLISAAGTSEILRIVSATDVLQGNAPRNI